ncbi:ComGF family competence protein [Oceanobacillus saliphilus]|uniref:ComGF family competence protein n=1 Tax=Oceanobacillus saliphilus TaxID=2925834 RepID=UPI00201E1E4E
MSILLMITVLSITLPLQGYMIQAAEYENNYAEISAQQFFQFLRDDVIKSTSIHASEKKLYLHQNDLNVTATFELYGSLIRRQVNGQGHEVYLRDVDAVTFSSLPYGVHVTVTMLSGDKYEKSIVHYK